MLKELKNVKIGLALVLLGLAFGIGMGISFGVNEDAYKTYIAETVAAHSEIHDAQSRDKIWRYAQRAHFHATGIAAFSLGLIFLVMFTNMRAKLKIVSSIFIGFSGLYPLSWFSMFLLAPTMGRDVAHHHYLTAMLTYVGVGSLLIGFFFLIANLFFGLFDEDAGTDL